MSEIIVSPTCRYRIIRAVKQLRNSRLIYDTHVNGNFHER